MVFEYSAEVIDPVPKEGRTHTPRFVKVVVQRMLEQHETALVRVHIFVFSELNPYNSFQ